MGLEIGTEDFGGEPIFQSEADRRVCWEAHRDTIMAGYGGGPGQLPGRRPWAFWAYDHRGSSSTGEREDEVVWRRPDTSEAERDAIEQWWRHAIAVVAFNSEGDQGQDRREGIVEWGVAPEFYDRVAKEPLRQREAAVAYAEAADHFPDAARRRGRLDENDAIIDC